MLGAAGGQRTMAAQSRFASYASERDCASDRVLSAAVCHSAFANARAEFEAKTGSFSSMEQCAKVYGSCAPWSQDKGPASFRPRWSGVDIVDTPQEKSVTPAVARGSKGLRFAARSLSGSDTSSPELLVRGAGRPAAAPVGPRPIRAARGPEPRQNSVPSGTPGGGFTLQDGVLTYPAPARFAPAKQQ